MSATETLATQAHCLRCGRKIKAGSYGRTCARKIRDAALTEAREGFSEAQRAKADELIRDGGIVETAPGLFEAVSSKGDALYATDGHSCTCHAGASDRKCYHLLSARILMVASRRAIASRRSIVKAA